MTTRAYSRTRVEKAAEERRAERFVKSLTEAREAKLRCKTDTAMVNEVLAKILCYNITVLIHSMYELAITPVFDSLVPDRTPVLAWATSDTPALLSIRN